MKPAACSQLDAHIPAVSKKRVKIGFAAVNDDESFPPKLDGISYALRQWQRERWTSNMVPVLYKNRNFFSLAGIIRSSLLSRCDSISPQGKDAGIAARKSRQKEPPFSVSLLWP